MSTFGGAAILLRRRSRSQRAPVQAGPDPSVHLRAARRAHVEGTWYRFYTELAAAARVLAGPDDPLTQRLDRCASEAGYSGRQPTNEEMDGDLRELDRLFEAQRRESDAE